MRIERYEKEAWKILQKEAHVICFNESCPNAVDRIDFAYLAVGDDNLPCGYVTCKEIDERTVYFQYGGSFPGSRGTIKSFMAYELFIKEAKSKYKRIETLIENTNKVMLKFAFKVGFVVIGIKQIYGSTMLILELDGY
jgi:hypothetical protein